MPMSPQRLAQNMHRPIEEGTNDTSATEWNAVIQELTQHKEEVQDLREGMNKLRQQFHKEVEDHPICMQIPIPKILYSVL